MSRWHYHGDVNVLGYGGSFYRRLKTYDGRRTWHVIEFTNMDDACGRDNEGHPTYCGDLREVDLDGLTQEQRADVARSFDLHEDTTEAEWAVSAAGYGIYAPLDSRTSNNGRKLIAELKRESRALEDDFTEHQKRMDRPVNKLGQTALEYQRGDMIPALQRGLAACDPNAQLVTKMYQATGGQTLGGRRVPIEEVTG